MRLAYGISRLVLAAVGVGSCADSFGPIGIFSRAGEGGTFTRDRGSEKWKNKPSYNVFTAHSVCRLAQAASETAIGQRSDVPVVLDTSSHWCLCDVKKSGVLFPLLFS